MKANTRADNRPLSVQQSVEHLKVAARMLAVLQTAFAAHSDSMISGEWAIVLAREELKRRWEAPMPMQGLIDL